MVWTGNKQCTKKGQTSPAKVSTAEQRRVTWITADCCSQCFLMKGRHLSLPGELNWKKVFPPSASTVDKNRLSPSGPRDRNGGLLWGVACWATPEWHTQEVDGCLSLLFSLKNSLTQTFSSLLLLFFPDDKVFLIKALSSFVAIKHYFFTPIPSCSHSSTWAQCESWFYESTKSLFISLFWT